MDSQTDLGLRCLQMSLRGEAGFVAQSDAGPTGDRVRQYSFVETALEIFSTVILSFPLIQEGQLPVSGERICTCTG